jgi:hypothetical protein
MSVSDDHLHPLAAIGGAMSTMGGFLGHYAPIILGMVLTYVGVYLDYRIRAWVRRRAEEDERKRS